MQDDTSATIATNTSTDQKWLRMPDGTKVRHRTEGYDGVIDGLTEIVEKGAPLNPDHRTQYRVHVGEPCRKLAAEADLLILADGDGLMMIGKQPAAYRREVTGWFRRRHQAEKFVAV